MRRVHLVLALVALLPVTARAEPVSVSLASSEGGLAQSGVSMGWFSIDFGTVVMPAGSTGTFLVEGLRFGSDYTASLDLEGIGWFDTLQVEILDPLDGDDAMDPADQPSYVPAGYSTSNKFDGFSFAQDSALERSAAFAGGSAQMTADETTHRGDILLFSGLSGAESARITFGLRDRLGDRGFLVRLSALGADMVTTPEPASMLLIGTGLAGIVGARRRSQRARRQPTTA